MSHRLGDGARVNDRDQWGRTPTTTGNRMANGERKLQECQKIKRLERGNEKGRRLGKKHTKATADGGDDEQFYLPPTLANPGTLVQGIIVGGGVMGHNKAHENEAPYPEKLAAWFIRSWCKPSGTVLDCFSGSGTTVAAAVALGRNGIGCDLRFSQCALGRKRCECIQPDMLESLMLNLPVNPLDRGPQVADLLAQGSTVPRN